MTKGEILIRKNFVNLTPLGFDNTIETMAIQDELMKHNFILTREAFDMIKSADLAEIIQFHKEAIGFLREFTGSGNRFKALYSNFPKDISFTDEEKDSKIQNFEDFWNNEPTKALNFIELKPATDEDFMKIFTDLCSVNNSLTPSDQKILKWFAKSNLKLVFPKEIPFKENLATLATILPQFTVKTVIDVLRIAVGFSGGDVSLPAVPKVNKNSKFNRLNSSSKSFVLNKVKEKRKAFEFKLDRQQIERILRLFENSNLDVRDMKAKGKRGRFIRLGEIIHPGKHSVTYPKTAKAFYALRNQSRKGRVKQEAKGFVTTPVIRTWASDVEKSFKIGYKEGLIKLSERPGEFLRRIDYLVRSVKNENQQNELFKVLVDVASKSSSKVIFEVMDHFLNRNKSIDREIFIKGARNKVVIPKLPPISDSLIDSVVDSMKEALEIKFSKLEPIGKCYVDEELKKITLPTNMRSLSDSLKPVVRGTRVKISDCTADGILRCFVHWNNDGKRKGGCDIDLWGTFCDKDLKGVKQIGFSSNNLGFKNIFVFSGDTISMGGRNAEYIDVNLKRAKEAGVKYISFDARDYKQGPGGFSTYKECVFGFCEVSASESKANTHWTPSSISNAMKLSSTDIVVTIAIIDVETMEYIWIDEDTSKGFGSNVGTNDKNDIVKKINRYTELPRLSIYDLIMMHIRSRKGEIVLQEEADKAFLFDDFVNSYVETLKYIGN